MTNQLAPAKFARPVPAKPVPTLEWRPEHTFLLSDGPHALALRVTGEMASGLYSYREEATRLTTGIGEEGDGFIMAHIGKLLSHYPPSAGSAVMDKLWWSDWIEDLEGVPADLIEAGCALWRRSAERWAPTPGQFLETIKPMMSMRQALLQRVTKTLELAEGRIP